MLQIPGSVKDFSAEQVNSLLQRRQPGVEVLSVAFEDVVQGASTRFRLVVDYAPGRDEGLPRSFFVKTVMDSDVPLNEIEEMIRASAGPGMYSNEVRFYRELRSELDIEAPRSFVAEFDDASNRFLLIVEDLAQRGVRFATAEAGLGPDGVARVLATVAKVHAAHWHDRRFDGDLGWLETTSQGPFADFLRNTGPTLLQHELSQSYKVDILGPNLRRAGDLAEAIWTLQELNDTCPPTLLHGDPHFANVYLPTDGAGGLFDWALVRRGCWAHDVSYFMGGALDVDARRDHEEQLLDGYLGELRANGVEAPSPSDAWRLYRANMFWGLLIWLLTPVPVHSEAAVSANVHRFASAVTDLNAFEALAATHIGG